jgi:hypothetical protein
MSPDLQRLLKLQQLETTIEEARRTIAAHPQRLEDADARLNEATQTVEAAKHRVKESQEARRVFEKDASVFQGRLSKFKDQLSEVKTNREYQAMQKEIEDAQSHLSAIEEKILERMMETDELVVEVKQAELALAAQQKDIDAEKRSLNEELTEKQATLERALSERTHIVAAMDSHLLALFEQVAKVRKGVALCTATRDGLCSVCHVRLRPQVFQEVRRNDTIIQCDSCKRILYYAAPSPPVEPPVTHPS